MLEHDLFLKVTRQTKRPMNQWEYKLVTDNMVDKFLDVDANELPPTNHVFLILPGT